MRSRLIVAAAVLASLAACTGTSDDSVPGDRPAATDGVSSTPPSVGGSADVPAATAPPVAVPGGAPIVDGVANGLVVVHDRDGGADALVSYRADGSLAATYSDAADATIWQPIWSPDGRRIAWSQTIDGTTWELVTSSVDGSERTVHSLLGRPDYLTYDPTATRVLALTPTPDGFGLVIVDVGDDTGDAVPAIIDLGRPYFSDFSPAGDRVVAHVGADLRIVGLDGARQPLDLTSSGHQTPAWHASEESVFFATEDETGNRLVTHDLTTGTTSDLATFDAFVLFDVDPAGAHVAVSAFGIGSGDGGLLAFAPGASQAQPAGLDGGLWLVDIAEASATRLAARPTAAPMWDPTGSRVLVRTTLGGDGRWVVYGLDGSETGTADFDIDESLLPAYLPFWDQYVRSQTLWSPDGSHFVHAGRAASGESGIWIHDAATTGPSTFLAAGDLAWWSPT